MAFYISRKFARAMPHPELEKWQFRICWRRFPMSPALTQWEFAIFKMTCIPTEGAMLHPNDYKGFWFGGTITPLQMEGAWNLPTLNELKEKCLRATCPW